MSPVLVGILGILVLLLVMFLLGMPVGFAMALVGFCGFCYVTSIKAGMGMIVTTVWSIFSDYGLTVIPLFILMGQVAFHVEVNKRLYHAAHKCIGQIRGGLALATIAACAAFSAICGSNVATAATMTSVAFPEMKKYKYEPLLSTGAIAAGSTLGIVIPPSVVLIVIGLYAGQSITKLFYGGIGAGMLLAILMLATVYVMCRLHPGWGAAAPKTSFAEKLRSLPGAVEMLILFFLVMLGLFFGFFTPTEAGATGAFFAILIALIEGRLTWARLIASVADTIRISCMVMVVVAGAVIFGRFLTITRIPYEIADWVTSLPLPGWMILAIVFIIYLIGGAVMDSLALLLITIPIFFPVAAKLGYDPIWFGVVVTVLTTIGAVTPPVGVTAYVVGGMTREDVSLHVVFKGVLYFMPAYILSLVLYMIFPQIVTFLPNLIR